MKLIKIINECILDLKEEDYRGEHSAPVPSSSTAPLYDLTQNFPNDIYSNDAVRLYGNNDPIDKYTMYIIQSARNKPNKQISIYRAIPKILTNNEKIAFYEKQQAYILKYGKLPNGVDNWPNRSEYFSFLSDEIKRLSNLPIENENTIKINTGDWVTINPKYAKDHGYSNLKNSYKILKKTVPAKDLYWDGGDINEWGILPFKLTWINYQVRISYFNERVITTLHRR